MTIPDYQSLMLPVLRLATNGETRVPDAAEKLADQLGLSVAEREEMLPSGRQRIFHNRIHWAKFYMTKAGLIDSRGTRPLRDKPGGQGAAHHQSRCHQCGHAENLSGLCGILRVQHVGNRQHGCGPSRRR
ncbi:winged helix-turn-helix domain-containing protein [Rhizobium sp. BIGb0125]|uniref:winged helix-turn-helix domain-containing protein n=1 Tax=Rhizobium sp. BIGb0125 TaxID=2940618 RepID=UPI002168096E|nr:winged helix-turn-helix domain-containing protein [Rhizobium sp. BIGb0125]